MAGKTGAARVALLTKAPVIPVAQWGANLAMPPYAKENKVRLFPRKTLQVQAGPPVDLARFYGQEPTARGAAGGDRGHHGRDHRPAGGAARRAGARRSRTIRAKSSREQRRKAAEEGTK